MKRCSPETWARCPDANTCERFAEFSDGSECDQFNMKTMAEIDAGRAQPDAAQQPFAWVPIKERLPKTEPKTVTWSGEETMQIEISEPVLVADGKNRKYVARYESGPAFQGWTEEESQITLHDVTFWAEIPEPMEV